MWIRRGLRWWLPVLILLALALWVQIPRGVRQPSPTSAGQGIVPGGRQPPNGPLLKHYTGTGEWQIPDTELADDQNLSGYTTVSSALPGRPVTFRLASRTDHWGTLSAFRVGWYGGQEAATVWRSGPIRLADQPRYAFVGQVGGRVLNMVDAGNWSDTVTVDTTGWPPGTYLFELRGLTSRKAHFIPFTLRSPTFEGKVVIINAIATWQAYNRFGGYSAYYGQVHVPAMRSRMVTFDRPYDRQGIAAFMMFERASIVAAERTGVPLAYATTLDLHQGGEAMFAGAKAIVTLGHDEYWTNEMVLALTRLRDQGTNLAFTGGNTMWWRVRFDQRSGAGRTGRIMTIYKSVAEDPVGYPDTTVNFPMTGPWASLPLLGVHYGCGNADNALVVTDPAFFLFRGTGVGRGTRVAGFVQHESDRVFLAGNPSGLQIAAHSPVLCAGGHAGRPSWSDVTYYTAPSGAGVVATGTMGLNYSLDDFYSKARGVSPEARRFGAVVFANLIRELSIGPLGLRHAATGNYRDVVVRTPNPLVGSQDNCLCNPNDPESTFTCACPPRVG